MKVLISILIGLLVVGCGKKEAREPAKTSTSQADTGIAAAIEPTSETKEPPANVGKALKPEDVVGSYEAGLGGITFRFVLLESGVVENYFNGIKEPEDAKWKIQGAEVHIEKGKSDGTVIVNKIESNGDFTVFARIRNGKREDFQNRTYKKIKSEKETPSKGGDKNSTTAKSAKELTKEDVIGTYELELKKFGETHRYVLLDNSTVEYYLNGKKEEAEHKWSIVDKEVHIERGNRAVSVFRHEPNGGLTWIAAALAGERIAMPKISQTTYTKIK